MLRLNNLSKSFDKKTVLHSIHKNFEKGKVYGIVGENGAGKTTLFNCIAGIEKHEGQIDFESENLKNKLGFLQTDLFFFSRMTGKEYLQLLANARHVEISNFDDLNIFELPLNEYAESYSTGMKKKLALTGVLLQKNDVFILDEPFNGVDIHSNLMIQEIIKKLKSANKLVLMSSHIFSTLKETCDEILILKNGQFEKEVIPQDYSKLEEEMMDYSGIKLLDKLDEVIY